jgi:putative transposase
LKHAQGKLRQLNKELSRRQKGSSNRRKTKEKLARAHARVADIRSDAIHKMTSEIVRAKRPSLIVIEHLNVKDMVKNHRLAQGIYDSAFNEARKQFEYKCRWYGSKILLADRWFPSSKTCSRCACIKDDLILDDRTYECQACGLVIDRDLNAAVNLKKYGELEFPCTASSAGRACGDSCKTSYVREAAVCEAGTRQKINQAAA